MLKIFKNLSKSLAVGVTAIALMLSCASYHKKDNDSITLKFDKSNVEMAVGANRLNLQDCPQITNQEFLPTPQA